MHDSTDKTLNSEESTLPSIGVSAGGVERALLPLERSLCFPSDTPFVVSSSSRLLTLASEHHTRRLPDSGAARPGNKKLRVTQESRQVTPCQVVCLVNK